MLNYASDDIVLRIQNLSPTKSTSFKISEIFDPKYFRITSVREKSLSLIYGISFIYSFSKMFHMGNPFINIEQNGMKGNMNYSILLPMLRKQEQIIPKIQKKKEYFFPLQQLKKKKQEEEEFYPFLKIMISH
jgi:hypothetical protein